MNYLVLLVLDQEQELVSPDVIEELHVVVADWHMVHGSQAIRPESMQSRQLSLYVNTTYGSLTFYNRDLTEKKADLPF